MSYKDKYGTTKIRTGKCDNLLISWDYDTDSNGLSQKTAVLLYTPWMGDTSDHYHIELNKKQATILRNWLVKYLNEEFI